MLSFMSHIHCFNYMPSTILDAWPTTANKSEEVLSFIEFVSDGSVVGAGGALQTKQQINWKENCK